MIAHRIEAVDQDATGVTAAGIRASWLLAADGQIGDYSGTPRHIVELLNTSVIAALDAPEVRDMLDSSGFQRIANSPAAAHAALEDDLANVLPLIRDLGIEAQ